MVERLVAAGAVIVGKTNVPEFGYSGVGHNPVFETTRNPWNTDMTPGGSSAGSGAAVASGMCPFAIGSDGGGSVRIPAAHCGLYGLKASMGRVPLYPGTKDERYPGVSSWESLEHIGPISRTVADSALMMSVIAGPDPRDRHSLPEASFDWTKCVEGDLKDLKVAYSSDWGYAAVDPRVRKIVGDAVKVFERDLGCTVEEAHPGWDDPYATFWGIVAAETDLVGLRALADKYEAQMTPHLVDFIRRNWTAEELTSAVMGRKTVNNKMWRFMQKYDLLLTPTLAVPAFPVHVQGPEKIDGQIVAPFRWLAFTFPMNLTGQPAATVPAGWTEDGCPLVCKSSAATWTTLWSCVPRRHSSKPALGETVGRWSPFVDDSTIVWCRGCAQRTSKSLERSSLGSDSANLCRLLQQHQDALVVERGCTCLSCRAADQDQRVIRNSRWPLSPILPNLICRTQRPDKTLRVKEPCCSCGSAVSNQERIGYDQIRGLVDYIELPKAINLANSSP